MLGFIYVSEDTTLFCPTINRKPRISNMITVNRQVRGCSSGAELLSGSDLSVTHVGSFPKIIKGKGLTGSAFSFMNLMGRRYGFKYTSTPAKNIPGAVQNVSLQPENIHFEHFVHACDVSNIFRILAHPLLLSTFCRI